MARNILAVRRPIIAAVNGDAIGLGATLSLFSDIVYMAEGARIADPHVKAGLVAADGGVVLWPLLLGTNRAKEFLLTGDLVSAPDADRIGLVNHVVPTDAELDPVMTVARRLAEAHPALSRSASTSGSSTRSSEIRVSQLYDLAVAFEAISLESADHREARDAPSSRSARRCSAPASSAVPDRAVLIRMGRAAGVVFALRSCIGHRGVRHEHSPP